MMNLHKTEPDSFTRYHEYSLMTDGPIRLGFTRNDNDLSVVQSLFPGKQTVELEQIHGDIILEAQHALPMQDGDGLFSKNSRYIPVIRTADCIPLFFWHTEKPFFGILHVGWRGFVARIQKRLLEMIRLNQMNIDKIRFLIGPAICADHYPVGPEVLAEFAPVLRVDEISSAMKDGRHQLDLKKALRLDLITLGASAKTIDDCGLCTFENPELPSYRREKNGARIFNFIAWE